jgi:hypothetical protein
VSASSRLVSSKGADLSQSSIGFCDAPYRPRAGHEDGVTPEMLGADAEQSSRYRSLASRPTDRALPLDAYLGNVGVLAASSQRGVTRSVRISRIPRRAATFRHRLE